MNIGQAAMLIGTSARMIRDLEQIGFIVRMGGTAGSRSAFSQMLRLICRGRDLGFTIERALILLQLWRARSDTDARMIARHHADALKRRITEIQAIVSVLEHLASTFKGDARGDSQLLDDMAEKKTATVPAGHKHILRGALRFAAEKPALARWRAPTVRRT